MAVRRHRAAIEAFDTEDQLILQAGTGKTTTLARRLNGPRVPRWKTGGVKSSQKLDYRVVFDGSGWTLLQWFVLFCLVCAMGLLLAFRISALLPVLTEHGTDLSASQIYQVVGTKLERLGRRERRRDALH